MKTIKKFEKYFNNPNKFEEENEDNPKYNREDCIKNLSDYTSEEKISFFDQLYEFANEELKHLEKNKWDHDDLHENLWSSAIEILSKDGDEFWKYWNSLDY